MDRQTWKAIQTFMNDSQKFAEALHGVSWKEGLSDDIVRSVEPFFAKNELGELGKSLRGGTAKGNTPPGKNSPQTGTRQTYFINFQEQHLSVLFASLLTRTSVHNHQLSLFSYFDNYR